MEITFLYRSEHKHITYLFCFFLSMNLFMDIDSYLSFKFQINKSFFLLNIAVQIYYY